MQPQRPSPSIKVNSGTFLWTSSPNSQWRQLSGRITMTLCISRSCGTVSTRLWLASLWTSRLNLRIWHTTNWLTISSSSSWASASTISYLKNGHRITVACIIWTVGWWRRVWRLSRILSHALLPTRLSSKGWVGIGTVETRNRRVSVRIRNRMMMRLLRQRSRVQMIKRINQS